MGLKHHADGGTASRGFRSDPEYLHVEGAAARQPPPSQEEEEEGQDDNGPGSDAEGETEEGEGVGPRGREEGGGGGSGHHKNAHQPLCRTRCVDLGTEGPPELPLEHQPSPAHTPQPEPRPAPRPEPQLAPRPDLQPGVKEYRAKLEFALKLGYSEETVRQVLSKLGPDTLTNDILGELVRRSTRSDGEPPPTSAASSASSSNSSYSSYSSSSSSTSSSSCGCGSDSVEGQRSDSPCAADSLCDHDNLRPIVVDGSNVAMSHGNKEVFSCHGIQLAVDWFLQRGHHDITVFVPAWRKEQSRPDAPISDQEILRRLEKEKLLVFTPSRRVQGRRVVCYDDRFIIKLAHESDGVIVSNDNYRDLANEKPEWKKFIDERLLMYSFVNDKFMPPDDPLGRHGPSLENFLRKRPVVPEQKKQPCPYGKKCTYGHKCKYYHPERGALPQRAVADELRASAKTCALPGGAKLLADGLVKSHSVPTVAADNINSNDNENSDNGAKKGAAKRQSDPSVRALSYSDAEDRLLAKGGGAGSPGPLPLTLPQEPPSRTGTPHDLLYPHCESPPDLSYFSLTRAFSSGRSLAPRFPAGDAEPWPGSQEPPWPGSQECDSVCYCEWPCPRGCCSSGDGALLDQQSPCYAQHGRGRLYAHHYHRCLRGYDPPPQPQPAEPAAASPTRALHPLPPRLQHQPLLARSSCPGDYRSLPPVSPGAPTGRRPAPVRADSVSDSRLYEGPPPLPGWESCYGPSHPPYPRYDLPAYHSLPDTRPPPPSSLPWGRGLPWGCQGESEAEGLYFPRHASHPGLHPSPAATQYLGGALPGNPRLHRHFPPPPSPPAPPAGRYEDVREKAYMDLCNIFPSPLVGRVMARSPHLTDAQQLAAAILAEKAHQAGY